MENLPFQRVFTISKYDAIAGQTGSPVIVTTPYHWKGVSLYAL
jgi:hypothetical protein